MHATSSALPEARLPRSGVVLSAEAPQAVAGRVVQSEDILMGNRVVDIQHNGSVYRLQATRLGKLILTK